MAMKAAISVELDGTMFALEEGAFLALRSYLDRARARLGTHPDRDDVLAGLERSIAARLARRSVATDAAVDEAQMQAALKEVGRVDGPSLDDDGLGRAASQPHSGPRRLYRLREGRQIAGVCAGLAAYAQIDVGIIRLIFIVCALFSGGLLLLAYLALMFIMPVAPTEHESDAGRGRGVRA
jgi:phage shock protein PspC (stress-responsive transcriptional regulator)